jgi:hypothetical protein
LIRQKTGLRFAFEIGVLSVIVIQPPLFALLIAMVGVLQLPSPRFVSARVTAVAMPSIAGSANEEERSALFAVYLKK